MITKGKEAKQKLLEGINEISDVVKMTLGAKGKTVLLSDKYGIGFSVTKDGYNITQAITFEDEIKNCGADFIKNAANQTVNNGGDGTTSTTILTQSMCNSMFNEIELGKNPNLLIKDLKEDLKSVTEFIQENSKKVENTEEIRNIAKVSSNHDDEISNLIRDIYDKAGNNVTIDVIESDDSETTFEIVNGYTMKETGYSSNVFINNPDKGRIEFNNPRIFLYNNKVRQMSHELLTIFMENADRNSDDFRPLVLIVEDIEEAPLREIVTAFNNQMIFSVAVVQTNLIYEDRKNVFIDTSHVIDAEYSDSKFGKFGECEKIIIEKDNVTFINGKGNPQKYIQKLKKEQEKNKDNIFLKKRLFSLESTAAIINVGGKLGTEISEKKDRIDDAVLAVKSSIQEGYCPGGSTMYLFAKRNLELKTEIMKEALLSCYKQLMINAELEPFYYLREIESKELGFGYNLIKDEITDFYKDGIFDSTKVLRIALENAVHTACNFALINATVS